MSTDLKEGQQVVVISNRSGHEFEIGETVRIKHINDYEGLVTIVAEHLDGRDYWFVTRKELELVKEASASEGEVKPTRTRYMYVVEDNDGEEIYKTSDRGIAREIKADYGGKKAGVVIIAYAAVKEIR